MPGKRGKFDFPVLFSRRIGLFRCGNIIYLSIFPGGGDFRSCPDDGKILTRAVSTTENVISSEDIDPFAAAILEGLSAGFIAMDGRFLVDKTAYGTASVEKIEGEVTVAEYLGYFTDREDSIFSRHLKVFGMGV